MPQDRLQIALDHHRAGRLRQAAASYRALIETDPQNAEAIHWLGVLAFQAGRPDQAIPLLQQAVSLRPDDAAFQYNLGQSYLAARRFDEAVESFELAARLSPNHAQTLFGWGSAHLTRGGPADGPAAAFAFRQAHLAGLDTAELHHHWGIAELATGHPDEALSHFQTALAKSPDDAVLHHQLARAYHVKGELKEARKALIKCLEIDPARASAWYALAALDAHAGNFEISASLFRKVLKLDPNYRGAWSALGRVLEQAGQKQEATHAFAQAVKQSRARPLDAAVPPLPDALASMEEKLFGARAIEFHHALAANADIFSPTHVPPERMKDLFDRYADTFNHHLVDQLGYHTPELLVEAIASVNPAANLEVLDLGCGTGLCGPLLRPLAERLCGVDLSPLMIEKARGLGVYDQLEVGELVDTLQKVPRSFDLLVASDVLIYLGDLGPTFEAAAGALRPGGHFAFTVEAGGGDRFHLHQKTLRFTHAESYLKRLAGIHGFVEQLFTTAILRYEHDRPVAGYIMVLRLPGSPDSP